MLKLYLLKQRIWIAILFSFTESNALAEVALNPTMAACQLMRYKLRG